MSNKDMNSNCKIRKLIEKLCVVQMILMFFSTVINILFLKNTLSEVYVQSGFLIVILLGICMNLLLLKEKSEKEDKVIRIDRKRNTLSIVVVVIISLAWITSYFFANFK